MRCMIEFEIPDNETTMSGIKSDDVYWQFHGYRGSCRAKLMSDIPVICAECEHSEIRGAMYCTIRQKSVYQSKPRWCPYNVAES